MRKRLTILLVPALLIVLAGCAEHNGPMERAGRAVDHAANVTVKAVGTAMQKTGAAVESGGQKVEQKVNQKSQGG